MLKIKEKQFDIVTKPGENVRRVLHLEEDGGKKVRGEIYTDHVRIVTELDRFSGSRLKLHFGIDVEGLKEGDLVTGSLLLATDEGEFRIPVSVLIAEESVRKPAVKVKTLSSFANLAKDDPEAAVRIWRNPGFKDLIPDQDDRLHSLYRGLGPERGGRQQVEEFLVGAGLKTQVRIHADFLKAGFSSVSETIQEIITLRRNTWGSFYLTAECQADFIEIPRTTVTEEDFVGLTYRFPYRINPQYLSMGENRAEIVLRCGTDSIRFQVTAAPPETPEYRKQKETDGLKAELRDLFANYLCYAGKDREFAREALPIAEKLAESASPPSAELLLMNAWLYALSGNSEEVRRLLDEAEDSPASSEENLLVLASRVIAAMCGLGSDAMSALSGKARTEFRRNPGSYTALKLMLLSDAELRSSPRRKLKAVMQTFESGCGDPLLFAEIMPELKKEDSLVDNLEPFMKKALYYATKKGLLTHELALRCAYLTANEKYYSEELMEILTESWNNWQSDGILEAIVRLAIKGQARNPAFFPWYEKAIERNIRIIRLYEYYIETLPENRRGILPLTVRKYFAMSDTLSENMKALVYANIIRNRREDPETYGLYREKMETFAQESLKAGRISEDYAVLYQKFTGRVTERETADRLLDVVFSRKIFTDEPGMRNVIVIHRQLAKEETVPLLRGTAYIRQYTKDSQVLFEDYSGRRYASCVCSSEPLMEREPFYTMCSSLAERTPGFLLSVYERYTEAGKDGEEMYRLMREMEAHTEFEEEFRQSLRRRILAYALSHPECGLVETLTEPFGRKLIAADKSAFIRILLAGGEFRKAYALSVRYGFEGISPDLCVRLASRMIDETDGAYDEELALFTEHVFRLGKYDERTLGYLTLYFRGSMNEMLELRKTAKGFFIDTFPLDERILARAAFTKYRPAEGPEILKAYSLAGGRTRIIRSYLEFVCGDLLGEEESISEYEASCIAEMMDRNETTDFPMRLAYLRYCSECGQLTAHEEVLADRILDECMKRELRMKFFQKLPATLISEYRLLDKVFVEQKADPSDTVTLRYTLTDGEACDGVVWKSEPMIRRYRGLFVREFTLFYGEVLTYEIIVLHEGQETVVSRGSVVSPFTDLTGQSAYQRINGIIRAMHEGDESEARELLRDYRKAENIARQVFRLEEAE